MPNLIPMIDLGLYVAATLVNLAITVLPIFKVGYRFSIRALTIDTALTENLLLSQPRFGRTIGFLERQVYLYALFINGLGLITAVVVFKAFAEWLKPPEAAKSAAPAPQAADIPAPQAADIPAPQAATKPDGDGQNDILARFYAYTIGNLLSILWAIIIFEVCRRVAASGATLTIDYLLAFGAIFVMGSTVATVAGRLQPPSTGAASTARDGGGEGA
ncbi:hypothetical protein [Falsiroseomonas ponticola]|uniref:hypothetical protein n=1 Tax=Falsiroseomonas ponticola TaxID=2786951 RepID=UPI0019348B9E|nr:hypothetical protein [Roseomonas ponticola]